MTQSGAVLPAVDGKCLCGAVRVRLEAPRRGISLCHCDMCLRWGGGPYAGVSAERFAVEGEEHIATYRSSKWAERAFCTACGSHLWFHFRPGDHRSFLAGLFDLPAGFAIEEQIFVDEKPAWYALDPDGERKTGAQVIAEAKAAGYDFG